MIQPPELKLRLPMILANGVLSTTTEVWETLSAAYAGNLAGLKKLVNYCPELAFAQYNYTPPIHLAVREGHLDIVFFLLEHGAYDPAYRTYPFQDDLLTIARDRERNDIAGALEDYSKDATKQRFKGDNGEILYGMTSLEKEFEQAVHNNDLQRTKHLLQAYPEFAKDLRFFWSEGILLFAAKENNRTMIDLLLSYGASVPPVLKWAQFYYFEHSEGAAYMIKKGMDPNTQSWQHVTLLHDMAQKGNIEKAKLLIDAGAFIDAIDEEYQSTPLGLAARWGQQNMVKYLLSRGADPNKSGASWSTPLQWAKKKGHTEISRIIEQQVEDT